MSSHLGVIEQRHVLSLKKKRKLNLKTPNSKMKTKVVKLCSERQKHTPSCSASRVAFAHLTPKLFLSLIHANFVHG